MSASEDWSRTREMRKKRSFQSIVADDARICRSTGGAVHTPARGAYVNKMICDDCRERYAIGGSAGIFLCPECYRERLGRDWKGDADEWAGEKIKQQRI